MLPWVAQALRLIAQGAGISLGFEAGQRAFGDDPGREIAAGSGGTFTGRTLVRNPVTGVFEEKRKRRRRRRALTASDRADIAFIVGLLGPTAGKNFAVTLAGRSR